MDWSSSFGSFSVAWSIEIQGCTHETRRRVCLCFCLFFSLDLWMIASLISCIHHAILCRIACLNPNRQTSSYHHPLPCPPALVLGKYPVLRHLSWSSTVAPALPLLMEADDGSLRKWWNHMDPCSKNRLKIGGTSFSGGHLH